jgi:hypothetical protein
MMRESWARLSQGLSLRSRETVLRYVQGPDMMRELDRAHQAKLKGWIKSKKKNDKGVEYIF